MMEMATDSAVVPEDTIQRNLESGRRSRTPRSGREPRSGNDHTWADPVAPPPQAQMERVGDAPPVDAVGTPERVQSAPKQGSVRAMIKRMTRLFHPDDEDMDPAQRKAHYRRGSILIKHLEDKQATGKATETDMKFFEVVKKRFDANFMESRTIISLSVFQTGSNPMDDPFAVIHMPVVIQQGFRRKLFSIFTLQLLAVVILLIFFSYVPAIHRAFKEAFFNWHYVFIMFVIMVLALLWLYLVKYRFPLNFMVLGVYTVTQSLFFAAFDCLFDTKASIFIFTFLFGIMGVTTVLSTMIIKRSFDPNIQPTLISYPVVLLIAFFLGFVTSLFIYFFYMVDVVSPLQYSASLAVMLLLIMWFAYDASCMNERLSPDEYMQGMVFFYTDMVLFLLFLSIIFVACFACEGDCACYGTADIVPIGRGGGDDDDDDGMDDDEGGEGMVEESQ
ncbi:N-methyl-D-aspartate receptor glutamate-binding subunit [Phytophthora cinnamomi]|uniref:N-methyl-D-aspartate receptor glutamate-binding subunit n=1 Tax=Phytophthora cinnamomi TaxID=4785 RepID=UPI00355A054A|nr:N-methyl-D-aspartate receptor glutamate-binding subunit [Phytophthora cinnamomi]